MNPKAVGERSEAMILAALLRAGAVVLQPFGDNQRYDLVVDVEGEFLRVQCKTARRKGEALLFNTCSSQAHRGKGRRDYAGQVELFGVYSPDTDRCYLVPVEEVGTTEAALRLKPSRTNSSRLATDYELEKVLYPKLNGGAPGR